MDTRLPLNVGLMDDDFFALKWNADLLTRDLRTSVCFETETPAELLWELQHGSKVEMVLLDVEYSSEYPDLSDLIKRIQNSPAKPLVVCLSQYGSLKALSTAIQCGARGFLLKREIRMEIVSALVMAMQVHFLITPGVRSLLQAADRKYPIWEVSQINAWAPHPSLTPHLRQVFTLRVLYGMSAPSTANKIHLAPGTVEKYMQHAYQKLSTPWADDTSLAGLNLEDLSPEVEAFHRFILPPISDLG